MKYKRNPDKIKSELVKNQSGQVVCKSACRIQTPVRFVEKGLSSIGVRTYIFGWAPLILESGDYAVMNACARIEINPSQMSMITIDDVDYYEFKFDAGTVVFPTDDVVQDDKIIYYIVDELIFKAKVPWFMNYDDVGKLLDSARDYADSRASEVLEVIELLASVVARAKNDERIFTRHQLKTLKSAIEDHTQFIPMDSVHLSVSGTINRIAGNYFEPAIEGALVEPSKKADNVEKILRA